MAIFDSKRKFLRDLRKSLQRSLWTKELEMELAAIQVDHEAKKLDEIEVRLQSEQHRKEKEKIAVNEKSPAERRANEARKAYRAAIDGINHESSKLVFVLKKEEEERKVNPVKRLIEWVKLQIERRNAEEHTGFEIEGEPNKRK